MRRVLSTTEGIDDARDDDGDEPAPRGDPRPFVISPSATAASAADAKLEELDLEFRRLKDIERSFFIADWWVAGGVRVGGARGRLGRTLDERGFGDRRNNRDGTSAKVNDK